MENAYLTPVTNMEGNYTLDVMENIFCTIYEHSVWIGKRRVVRLSLIGFHSFTGSDFTLSFFNKGKSSC